MLRGLTIRSDEKAIEHYVYDLDLPIEERSAKRLVFKSGMAAANWLGISPKNLNNRKQIGNRIYSPTHGRQFAVRQKKCTDDRRPI